MHYLPTHVHFTSASINPKIRIVKKQLLNHIWCYQAYRFIKGTLKVVYRHGRCILTWKMPSASLSYTMSFVVKKTMSSSNATLLSYLVLHRHQASGVTREVTDFFFLCKYFCLLWFVYKPELRSKFSLSTFLHFPINHAWSSCPVPSLVSSSCFRCQKI